MEVRWVLMFFFSDVCVLAGMLKMAFISRGFFDEDLMVFVAAGQIVFTIFRIMRQGLR